MPINEDDLLVYTLQNLCNCNKTINLPKCQKKFHKYNNTYDRDDNILITYKTYKKNLKTIQEMINFTLYPNINPALYYQEIKQNNKKKQKSDSQKLLTKNFYWKQFSSQFFYTRLLLLTELWFDPHRHNSMEEAYNIPTCFFPLYYSILIKSTEHKEEWKSFKKSVLSKTYEFFYEFNGLIPNRQHDKEITKDILPFSTKNIFSFYHALLEHYFPNELFELAQTAQKALEELGEDYRGNANIAKGYFRSNMQKFSGVFFDCQDYNSLFSHIAENIINSSSIPYTDNIYSIDYSMVNRKNIEQRNSSEKYSNEMALEHWTTLQSENKIFADLNEKAKKKHDNESKVKKYP